MKKAALLLIVTAALALTLRGTTLEDDPIRSLSHPDPVRAALFDRYQEKSFFRDRVFVEMGALTQAERERLAEVLRAAGYREVGLVERPSADKILELAPLLPAEDVRRLVDEEALARRAREALSIAMLPGGDTYLRELQDDPIGLGPAVLARLVGPSATSAVGPLLHGYRSPRPLDYEQVGRVYDLLVGFSPRVHFIGGDFFALENYRAVKHDILVCSALSLVLNLVIFFCFTGRWALLALLFLGSVVSNLVGLLAIRAFYTEVYALVLAYTSTFIGFNNESLVHLAGIEATRRRRSLLGIWSAIGTTFIGFLVLLLGRSTMVRQMALASLGGMVGFLLFLVPYRATLATVRFRGFAWPKLTLRPRWVAATCAVSVLGLVIVGVPPVATRIEGFRYQTPTLDAQVTYFSQQLDALSLEDVVAVPAAGEPGDAIARLAAAGLLDPARHPLAGWRRPAEQEETLRALRERYPLAVARLTALLAESGIRIEPAAAPPARLRVLDAWEYLEELGSLGPVRWADRVGGQRFVMAGLRASAHPPAIAGAIPVSPRHYYDQLLTALSRELGWLFLAGLAVMAIYLVILQRSASRALYAFAPLFMAALAFAAWARATGSAIHIVHIMGFSLVIALALDYTAVAVSNDHGDVELSKILLTGLSTLATFGVLVLARHPVLHELGATVAIGCGVSLVFALVFRLPPGDEGAP